MCQESRQTTLPRKICHYDPYYAKKNVSAQFCAVMGLWAQLHSIFTLVGLDWYTDSWGGNGRREGASLPTGSGPATKASFIAGKKTMPNWESGLSSGQM